MANTVQNVQFMDTEEIRERSPGAVQRCGEAGYIGLRLLLWS